MSRLFKKLTALALALAVGATALPFTASSAEAGHRHRGGVHIYYGSGPYYSHDPYYYGRHRYYRHHRRHHRDAFVAGIAGLAIGTIIGSTLNQPRYYRPHYRSKVYYNRGYRPAPWSRAWYRYCSAKYRSFDPYSGTFQPYHGPRKLCR